MVRPIITKSERESFKDSERWRSLDRIKIQEIGIVYVRKGDDFVCEAWLPVYDRLGRDRILSLREEKVNLKTAFKEAGLKKR